MTMHDPALSATRCAVPLASPAAGTLTPRVAVVFATRGRADVLDAVIARLADQTLAPHSIVISCTGPADVGRAARHPGVTVLTGPAGLARQRNTALRHIAGQSDIVVFFDDDFLAAPDWLAIVAHTLAQDSRIAAVTGALLADDIKGPGLPFEAAAQLLADPAPRGPRLVADGAIPYGCNMAFRADAIGDLRFDERLVRYGWLEDRDFGAALMGRGYRSVKISDALGVHMGVKRSRVPGRMLGYSQVVNPVYLHRKGTMPVREVVRHIARNVLSNLVGALRPEPYIDRRGRLVGNFKAARDLCRGLVDPQLAERM